MSRPELLRRLSRDLDAWVSRQNLHDPGDRKALAVLLVNTGVVVAEEAGESAELVLQASLNAVRQDAAQTRGPSS